MGEAPPQSSLVDGMRDRSWDSLCPGREPPFCKFCNLCSMEVNAGCTSLFLKAPLCLVSSLSAS